MDKKTKRIGIILLILIVVGIGITYAWLTTTIIGTKEYVLKAGTLKLVLDETLGNEINIPEAYPMSDEEGKIQDTKFVFTVENTGTVAADYEIYLDDAELDEGDTRVSDSNIHYSLTVTDQETVAFPLDMTGIRRIVADNLAAGASKTYELRLWVKQDSTASYNEVFSGKLRIEAIQEQ